MPPYLLRKQIDGSLFLRIFLSLVDLDNGYLIVDVKLKDFPGISKTQHWSYMELGPAWRHYNIYYIK